MKKLRVGLIIDDNNIDTYNHELIKLLSKNDDRFYSPILLCQQYKVKRINSIYKLTNLPSLLLNRLIDFGESWLLTSYPEHSTHCLAYDPKQLNLKTHNISPVISKSGFFHEFTDRDLCLIKENKFDVLIRCGKGILKGDILDVAKFGILSFHHGDNRLFRGVPAGFWEVHLNIPSTGFIIQQLTDRLDGGNVLLRGSIPTSSFWKLNNARISKKSNNFMFQTLCRIQENASLPTFESSEIVSEKIYKFPSFIVLSIYFFRQIQSFMVKKLFFIMNYQYRWSVSFKRKDTLLPELNDSITIRNKPKKFLADPFVVNNQGRDICFLEEYSYEAKKGHISAYELLDNSYVDLGIVLEEHFHLSFPYIFEYDNKFYMCPETAEKNDIRIYESMNFPFQWKLKNILISDISAADSVIFPFSGTWFLLTNVCSGGMSERNSELHLYHADNPILNQWKPSANNPVIFDSQKARNGGLFTYDKKLYRVNQRHHKARYGVSFEVNEILNIEKNQYNEKLVKLVEPNFFASLDGTHHYHENNNFVVFDHCRLENISK